MGRHAAPGGVWRTPAPWAMLLATVTWMLTMWRNTLCVQTTPDVAPNPFHALCYTDIPVLYMNRGLNLGSIPLVDIPMEYPVLTAWVMEIARRAVNFFGGYSGPDATAWQTVHGAEIFFAVTAIIMFLCFLGLVIVHLRLHRPWDALLIAGSPLVVAGGLINWDMLVVFLAGVAILMWSRKRTFVAGLFLGFAIAAKLYPVFWLLPLAVLCLRSGKIADFTKTCWGTLLGWLAINLPMYIISPSNWLGFWTFNVDRGADLGSIWYVFSLAGYAIPSVSTLVTLLLGLSGLAIAVLFILAPRRPRLVQGLFLITIAFLVLNKVYSPQYMLWILPLLILVRPKAREVTIFTLAELAYWAAIWGHLAQTISGPNGAPEFLYWFAVLLRIGVQLWLAGLVVRDILRPEYDPFRLGRWTDDDPDGGIFDHATDKAWVQRLQRRMGIGSWPAPTTTPADDDTLALFRDPEPAPPQTDPEPVATVAAESPFSRPESAPTPPDAPRPGTPVAPPTTNSPSDQ